MINLKLDKREEDLENIRLAHKQWKERESFFHEVTDPDLIDYAIFQLEASRLKYIYLLKRVRKEAEGQADKEEELDRMEESPQEV